MRFPLTGMLLAALVTAGCGEYETGQPRGRSAAPEAVGVVVDPFSMGEPVQRPTQEAATPDQPAPGRAEPDRGAAYAQQAQAPVSVPQAAPLEQPPAQGMVREQAAAGAGRKGHYSQGIITTPLSTYWRAQERITYEAQVTYPLKLYKAEHGNFPKTQEEFVEKILKPNRVELPELPEGHRYVYDPDKGELLVERPR